MVDYVIVPWIDTATGLGLDGKVISEFYIPPEMDRLAELCLKQYDMVVRDKTMITSKSDKGGAIWKLNTNHGTRSLKVLHRTPKRSLFSVEAQQYLVSQGARIPQLIRNKKGELYCEFGGKVWIVSDWIDSLVPATKIDLSGAKALCFGLGEFHHHSKKYAPPSEAAFSSRVAKWPKHYAKMKTKMAWFREIATIYRDLPNAPRLLELVGRFEKQADEQLKLLQASDYDVMVRMGDSFWGLAHQDFGWSNGQLGDGGLWIIDLDGVAFDFPFRDLRKLISSTMDDMGVWDLQWIRGMIQAYHQGNPLSQQMYELLVIDLAFPNEFYKHVKEMVFDPVPFFTRELGPILDRIMLTEQSKWIAIAELRKDMTNYKRENYEPTETELVVDPAQTERKSKVHVVPAYKENVAQTALVVSPKKRSKKKLPVFKIKVKQRELKPMIKLLKELPVIKSKSKAVSKVRVKLYQGSSLVTSKTMSKKQYQQTFKPAKKESR